MMIHHINLELFLGPENSSHSSLCTLKLDSRFDFLNLEALVISANKIKKIDRAL